MSAFQQSSAAGEGRRSRPSVAFWIRRWPGVESNLKSIFWRRARSKLSILVVLAIVILATGCVQRRLIVRSHPEGALVTIDSTVVGHTPVPVPFVYYGTREIQLEKEGFKTIKVKERIRPPWYEKVPFSFFSNNFAFREIRDERLLEFELEPRTQVEENLLLDRANELRVNSQRGTLAAPGNQPFGQ